MLADVEARLATLREKYATLDLVDSHLEWFSIPAVAVAALVLGITILICSSCGDRGVELSTNLREGYRALLHAMSKAPTKSNPCPQRSADGHLNFTKVG